MFTTTRTEVRETFEPIPAALRSEVREELAYTAGWRRGFAWGIPTGLALMLAAALLAGCAAIEFREENGPLGPASMKVTPPAFLHRTSKTRRVEATPTSPATDESECEGGVCAVPGSK